MIMNPGIITVFDIGSSSIKAVVVRKRLGLVSLLRAEEILLSKGAEPSAIAGLIHDFIARHKLEKAGFITCVNRNSCLVKFIKLPTLNKEEIADMLPFELEKHIPPELGEVVTSHRLIRQDRREKGFSEVLIAIIKRDLVEKHLQLLAQAGVTPVLISLSSLALADALLFSGYKQGQALLLNIGVASTEINILAEGELLFSRSIPIRDEEQPVVSARLKILGDEIEQSVEAFRSERQQSLHPAIYLAGSGSGLPGLAPYLRGRFHADIVPFDPFTGWNSAGEIVPEQRAIFAQAMGLAAEAKTLADNDFNLMPADLVSAQARQGRKKLVYLASALVLLVIMPLFLLGIFSRINTKKEINKINERLSGIKTEIGQAKEMQNKVQLYHDCVKGKEKILESLRQLSLSAPSNVFLDHFAYDRREKTINIRGKTTSHAAAAGYAISLDKTGYFDKIVNKGSREEKFNDLSLVSFEMDCQLKEENP
jgi:type IV pilus assembly protein PilM